jgi:hypothetical protein
MNWIFVLALRGLWTRPGQSEERRQVLYLYEDVIQNPEHIVLFERSEQYYIFCGGNPFWTYLYGLHLPNDTRCFRLFQKRTLLFQ